MQRMMMGVSAPMPSNGLKNGRLEYHPALAGTGKDVLLGLVGKQDLQRRGWVP